MAGCWHSFMKCVGNRQGEPIGTRYQTSDVESIKFEDLLTLEQREKESQIPIVSESELQFVKDGRLDQLAEEQLILDRQKDEELRKQEEQLRLEEEAYYAAKRKAAKKSKQPITVQPVSSSSSTKGNTTTKENSVTKKDNLPTWLTDSPSSSLVDKGQPKKLSLTDSDNEEDFDIFLKNVKAKNASLSKTSPEMASKLHSVTSDDDQLSDDEAEIDFGYWESAAGTANGRPGSPFTEDSLKTKEDGLRSQGNLKEVDLNLL